MSPKRGDDVPSPPIGDEWRPRFATNEAAKGWGDLCTEAPGNTRRCFEALRTDPLSTSDPDRRHRLRGRLSTRALGGRELPQWEFEVTAGGRVRYLVDEAGQPSTSSTPRLGIPRTPTTSRTVGQPTGRRTPALRCDLAHSRPPAPPPRRSGEAPDRRPFGGLVG